MDNKKKKIVVIAGAVIVLLLVAGIGRSFFAGKDNIDLSDTYVAQKEAEVKTVTPPPLESKFDSKKLEELSNKAEIETESSTNTNDSTELTNLSSVPFGEIEKKPSDMYEYLTLNQAKFDFQKQHLAFVFEERRYLIGEKFKGWWLIEEITPNFIRFYDIEANYAYNLRFLR